MFPVLIRIIKPTERIEKNTNPSGYGRCIMSLQHYDENTSIHFKNISSNKEEFLEAKENLDLLLRKAPCGSNCRLKISAIEEGFKGHLEVHSKGHIFRVEHQDSSVRNLQTFLFKSISKELDQWKKDRSEKDITGVVRLESLFVEQKKEPKRNK